MESTKNEVAIDEQAARVALTALFGTIPHYQSLDETHARVAPDAALLSLDSAVRLLATMPKPLLCYADNMNGTLTVSCELLDAASDDAREQFELRLAAEGEGRRPFDYLTERYGDDDHVIAVFGRSRVELVRLSAVRQWSRDYEIDFSLSMMDDANNVRAQRDPEYAAARKLGAKGILKFMSPAASLVALDGTRFEFPPGKLVSQRDRERLERAMIAIAKVRLLCIEAEEDIATVERMMVENGAIPADSIGTEERDRQTWVNRVFASQLEYQYKGRAMPPEAEAFIDACRSG